MKTSESNNFQVCIECGKAQNLLFIDYGKGNIKLLKCPYCQQFADKYLEYEDIVVFIDMLLHKPQVYRHVFLNRDWEKSSAHSLQFFTLKLSLVLVLFEVYVKWAYQSQNQVLHWSQSSIFEQYLAMFCLCLFEFMAWHGGLILAHIMLKRGQEFQQRLTLAVILSSFGKLLLILLAIWHYNDLEYAWLIHALTLSMNYMALDGTFSIHLKPFECASFSSIMALLPMDVNHWFNL